MRSLSIRLLALVLLLNVSGCSGGKAKKFKVTGKLTKGGVALPLPPSGGPPAAGAFAKGIQLAFIPFEEGDQRPIQSSRNVFANVEDDGSYEVVGGLPAGKYLVTVKHTPRGPTTEDSLNDRFSLARSPITVEVTADTVSNFELDSYP